LSAVATGVAFLALAVSPLHVVTAPGGQVTLTLRNTGAVPIAVAAEPAAYRLDLLGRPLLAPVRRPWLSPSLRRLELAPGATALLAVHTARLTSSARGDHAQVLLLTATVRGGAIRVAARIGVVIVIRRAGRLVHRLVPGRLRVRGRMLRLLLVNRGNVDEWIGAGRLRLSVRGIELRARPRRILAGGSGLFEWRLPARLRGVVSVRAAVEGRVVKRYRLRL
jgi:hypothetical protein